MLLPILEGDYDRGDGDGEDQMERLVNTLLVTGGSTVTRNHLFYQFIRKYFKIPISVLEKQDNSTSDGLNPYPDVLVSLLKGLEEDIHGKIVDLPSTPLPHIVISEENKESGQQLNFCLKCPTHNSYPQRSINTSNVDILLRIIPLEETKFDLSQIGEIEEIKEIITHNIQESVYNHRFKHIIILFQTEAAGGVDEGVLGALQTVCEEVVEGLLPKSEYLYHSEMTVGVTVVDVMKGLNIFSPISDLFETLFDLLMKIPKKPSSPSSKPIFSINSYHHGKAQIVQLSPGTSNSSSLFKILPSQLPATLNFQRGDPLEITFELGKADLEDAGSIESSERSDEEIDGSLAPGVVGVGDVVVLEDECRVNLSEKLMLEIEIFGEGVVVTKGFNFELCVGNLKCQAEIKGINEIVTYTPNTTDEGKKYDRSSQKVTKKIVKGGDIFIAITSLEKPILIGNYTGYLLGLCSIIHEGKTIGRANVHKHVPFKG